MERGVWPTHDTERRFPRADLVEAECNEIPLGEISGDLEELLVSPSNVEEGNSSPLYRTDDSQTEMHEPLSPVAIFKETTTWRPAGSLSHPTSYDIPDHYQAEPTCPACGRNVLAHPKETRGYQQSGGPLTAKLVSYERERMGLSRHYESVPLDGPNSLKTAVAHPAIHCFCSQHCRENAEYRTPRQLVHSPESHYSYASGTQVGTYHIEC